MPKIFQRFYRVDKARSRAAGGTGLGLSIVRDAVRPTGEITVAPRTSAGVVFTVLLLAEEGGHRRELRPQSGFRPAAGPAHLDSLGRVRPNREESGYLVYYRNQAAVDSAGAAEALVAERHTLDPSADPVEGLLELVMAQPRGKTSPPPCRRG